MYGVHTIVNFFGAIGHLLKGSGLEDVLTVFFGSSTIEHVLSGKAYVRAVRGHRLIHTSLTDMLLLYLRDSNLSCDDVDLVRSFLLADRTNDWSLHLDTASKMLPLIAAVGHTNYAKAARIYLQKMRESPSTLPWLNERLPVVIITVIVFISAQVHNIWGLI